MNFNLLRNEHFFFGPQSRSLFGSYHIPSQESGLRHGILLCYPFGFEYIRAHRTFRQLAVRLAKKGFNVLRFDFFGTGDSSGDFENVRLQHWMEDLRLATEELKRLSGVRKICAVGLRLGASIAAMSAKDMPDLDTFVLWEPVISGEQYLQEIADEDKKFGSIGSEIEFKHEYDPDNEYPTEILGFPMPSSLFKDLHQLDLLSDPFGIKNAHLVCNDETPEVKAYYRKLNNRNGNVTLDVIDDQKLWLEEPYKALVPVQTLNRIINYISEKVR
jgi:uncharacterized protein